MATMASTLPAVSWLFARLPAITRVTTGVRILTPPAPPARVIFPRLEEGMILRGVIRSKVRPNDTKRSGWGKRRDYICSGYIYGANVGWINVGNGNPANHVQYADNSAADFGVN